MKHKLVVILLIMTSCYIDYPWQIYKNYDSGKLWRLVENGRCPVFAKNGKRVYYLKEDGVHLIDINGKNDVLIIQGKFDELDINYNTNKLALIIYDGNKIELYDTAGKFLEEFTVDTGILLDAVFNQSGESMYLLTGFCEGVPSPSVIQLVHLSLFTHEKRIIFTKEIRSFYRGDCLYEEFRTPNHLSIWKDSLIAIEFTRRTRFIHMMYRFYQLHGHPTRNM